MKEQLIKLQDKVAAPSTSGDRGFGAERANYAGEEHQSGHNWRSNGGEGPRRGLVTGRSMVGEEALGHMAEAGRSILWRQSPTDTPTSIDPLKSGSVSAIAIYYVYSL